MSEQAPMDDQPWDICECGDYRDQHENNSGRCIFGRAHVPMRRCLRFVFASRNAEDEMNWKQGACSNLRPGLSRESKN